MLKKIITTGSLTIAVAALLTGCSSGPSWDDQSSARYDKCVEAGGSYWEDAYEQRYACVLPNTPVNKNWGTDD